MKLEIELTPEELNKFDIIIQLCYENDYTGHGIPDYEAILDKVDMAIIKTKGSRI